MLTTTNPIRLYAASLTQSTEQTRYYLQGVCIQRHPRGEGLLYITTDGHRMTVAHDPDAEWLGPLDEAGAILPIDKKTQAALKSRKAESVRYEGDMLYIRDANETPLHVSPAKLIDGTFPDWRRVLPGTIGEPLPENVGFDPAYLGAYAPLTKAADLERGPLMVTPCGNGPVVITLGGADWFRGLLMPCTNMRDTMEPRPDWLAEWKPDAWTPSQESERQAA